MRRPLRMAFFFRPRAPFIVNSKMLGNVMRRQHGFHDRAIYCHRRENLFANNGDRPMLIAEHVAKPDRPGPTFMSLQASTWCEHHNLLQSDADEHATLIFLYG